ATPTAEPTATPTAEPTVTPTAEPTVTPTAEPTATPTDPVIPDDVIVHITKKIEGVEVKDLPDGTVFTFEIYDSLNGGMSGKVNFSKNDLLNGNKTKPVRVPGAFGIIEKGFESVDGYDVTVDVELKGVKPGNKAPDDGKDGIFVGSFEIDTVPFEPGGSVNPQTRTMPELEIIITNTFTLIDPSQKIPSDINMPKTGDESDILLWMGLALTSMTGLALVSRKKREA
ncbi:MAG: LPXTG cell wall anchor domain-containing protein, partial [Clostridia bacterium]|nr:LPXTG cell wall anchor domain-containing protein [Clostridia bacterium]